MSSDIREINDLLNAAEPRELEVEAMTVYVSARTDGKAPAEAAAKAMAEWDLAAPNGEKDVGTEAYAEGFKE